METINLKCKLKAYTRGIHTNYIEDVTDDHLYGRTKGKWVDIEDAILRTKIDLEENSGLHETYDEATHTYLLGVNQENITEVDLPEILKDDTVYYVEDLTPTYFVDGGTAWSDGGDSEGYVAVSQYGSICDGYKYGAALLDDQVDIDMCPINARGVYINGRENN